MMMMRVGGGSCDRGVSTICEKVLNGCNLCLFFSFTLALHFNYLNNHHTMAIFVACFCFHTMNTIITLFFSSLLLFFKDDIEISKSITQRYHL